MPNLFTLIALLCWIPLSVAIFMWLPVARALSVSYVAGWLLLPFVSYDLPAMPDFSKANAVFAGSAIGLLISRDARRLFGTFRFMWFDLLAGLLCVSAIITSILNGLGIWDGVASSILFLCMWTGPYFLGRLAFRSTDDVFELAKAIFVGGLGYIPLCLFEIRMSPQLHGMLYGSWARASTSLRFGGYRPSVFLECGIELGMWMTASCLVGIVLWHQGRYRKLAGMPVSALLFALLVTTILCKSTGALALFVLGLGCWVAGRHLRSGKPVAILVMSAVIYIIVRGAGLYDGAEVVDFTRQYVDEERAASLEFRLKNEDLLCVKAFERPWFGWGGWGNARVYDDEGNDISVTDGRWIIIFGNLGLIGLLGTYGTLLCPCLSAIRRYGGQLCRSQEAAPVVALIVTVALFAFDSLLNNFANPIYLLSAGAVGSIAKLAPWQTFHEGAKPATTTPWPSLQRRSWPPPSQKHPAKLQA